MTDLETTIAMFISTYARAADGCPLEGHQADPAAVLSNFEEWAAQSVTPLELMQTLAGAAVFADEQQTADLELFAAALLG